MTRINRIAALLFAAQFPAEAQNNFTDAEVGGIKAFLQDNFHQTNTCIVIGLVDERGTRIISAGKLDNGTREEVNGDTIFEIGSITKTLTALLSLDMVERGEMKLDDPVAKYLPKSVTVPTHNGKEMTLLSLAEHTSGLPRDPNNLTPTRGLPENAFADYTAERLYGFLSSFTLSRDPGAQFEYSNVGMALLGHVLACKAGTNYESLLVKRICDPLKLDSTRITLTPEQRARLAQGHDQLGKPAPNWEFQVYDGAGGLRSTANDLLKYISANLGLVKSSLTPLMEETHVIRNKGTATHGDTAMAWMNRGEGYQSGMDLLGHTGATGGYETFIGFDKEKRRGVVVLCNQQGGMSPETLGWLLLKGVRLNRAIANALSPATDTVGVGIALSFDAKTSGILITKVLPDSPASQAGLSAGLIIQTIDDVSTGGKGLTECVGLIRGVAGTKIRLELFDPKQNTTNAVELTRRKIQT
jgi:CubicO group peptidase (beta-lactamase class C family)